MLVQPDPSKQLVVEGDALDAGVGAELSQHCGPNDKLHPCTFLYRCLSPAEQNYDVGNWGLLAMKLTQENWLNLLEGTEQSFIVWTDHKNVSYLQLAKCLNSHQATWPLFFGVLILSSPIILVQET